MHILKGKGFEKHMFVNGKLKPQNETDMYHEFTIPSSIHVKDEDESGMAHNFKCPN